LLISLLEIALPHSDAYFSKCEICASKRYMLKASGELLSGSVIFQF
jgi:hypothetical protein